MFLLCKRVQGLQQWSKTLCAAWLYRSGNTWHSSLHCCDSTVAYHYGPLRHCVCTGLSSVSPVAVRTGSLAAFLGSVVCLWPLVFFVLRSVTVPVEVCARKYKPATERRACYTQLAHRVACHFTPLHNSRVAMTCNQLTDVEMCYCIIKCFIMSP